MTFSTHTAIFFPPPLQLVSLDFWLSISPISQNYAPGIRFIFTTLSDVVSEPRHLFFSLGFFCLYQWIHRTDTAHKVFLFYFFLFFITSQTRTNNWPRISVGREFAKRAHTMLHELQPNSSAVKTRNDGTRNRASVGGRTRHVPRRSNARKSTRLAALLVSASLCAHVTKD